MDLSFDVKVLPRNSERMRKRSQKNWERKEDRKRNRVRTERKNQVDVQVPAYLLFKGREGITNKGIDTTIRNNNL